MNSITRRTWMPAASRAGVLTQQLRGALRGVHNFLTSPLRPDLSPDADGLRRSGPHRAAKTSGDMTIEVVGGLGELFTMNADEQRTMAAAAVTGSAGRLPVVVGAGSGYRLAMRMADGAFHYFRDVAASVRIGLIAYPRGQEAYWPAGLKRLAEIPNVIGFKDPTGGRSIGQALGSLIEERLLETGIDPMVRVRSLRPNYGINGIKMALETLDRAGGPLRPPGNNVAPEDRAAIAGIARKHAEA